MKQCNCQYNVQLINAQYENVLIPKKMILNYKRT